MKDLDVTTLVVGQMQTNCYIVMDKISKEALIIDPGDDPEYIIDHLMKSGAVPKLIIATHGHFDHTLGAFSIQQNLKIHFAICETDEFLLNRQDETARHYLKLKHTDPAPIVNLHLKSGDHINIGQHRFKVIESPGHTPGSICLYDDKDGIIFAGDLIFSGGAVGRTDFKYSSLNDLRRSIQKILKLPPEITVYPGHGEKFKILQFGQKTYEN